MKNPCNPVFSNEKQYATFRARFSIWIPSLKTLDGTDFKDDTKLIGELRAAEEKKKAGGDEEPKEADAKSQLATDKSVKASAGSTAFGYNAKAHKKSSSQRSLFDRIMKSKSEGNRFIRNDDL
mgnify:FL=1